MTTLNTPITYSAPEARQIRARFHHGDQDLHCPRCREPLIFGPLVERGNSLYGEIYCDVCHRCLMLRVGAEQRIDRERFTAAR